MSPHELVLPQLASAYAFELFRPLQELPADESELLMKTIREVVSCSFNVGMSARRLDVHRHTIENRIAKVEQLIGLDLSLESDRVKIYIALAFIRNAM
jgi:sugar diacid utilization regulator